MAAGVTTEQDADQVPSKMHLVPCRWSKTGWKYVEVDPKNVNFLNNPNRVNSFGVEKRNASNPHGARSRQIALASKSAFAENRRGSRNETTYGSSFLKSQK